MILPNGQTKITDFVKKAYHEYFGVKLGIPGKPFAPHFCGKVCVEILRDWKNGKRESILFAIPMVRREGKNPITDYYFCMINLKGVNRKNKYHAEYHDVPSVKRLIHIGLGLPAPEPDGQMEYGSDSVNRDMTCSWG